MILKTTKQEKKVLIVLAILLFLGAVGTFLL